MDDSVDGVRSVRSTVLATLQRHSGATESEVLGATNLFDDGTLTSLSLAYVVMELEAELDIELMGDLHVPDWRSVSSITDLLARRGARP